jgi:hypothetical protein
MMAEVTIPPIIGVAMAAPTTIMIPSVQLDRSDTE